MSNLTISTSSNMDMDHFALPSAIGTPLTTIPEVPDDECEYEEEDYFHNKRTRAMFRDNSFITASATESADMDSSKSRWLSINMSSLSPSSPTACSSMSSSPPSASYSSCSSAVSSPGSAFSPSLNPFQWTSDLRQYIMTDIGPQPSNSPVPVLRSHMHLVRQRSYSKIGGPGFVAPSLSLGSTGSGDTNGPSVSL
ncbi:hypothetical protein BGZ99_004674 [Dissophora globulifera]|uniref:Uncharacterized protein n=1 Tax=Dissophora globulifera TaxID=979702 RepID=A0A9P6UUE9_9FUNG|nr:hypothetical protein BGZ99_004674 [Dissophora globulifera]